MASHDVTNLNLESIEDIKEIMEYSKVDLVFKPEDTLFNKCNVSKNIHIMLNSIVGEKKRSEMATKESEELKARVMDYDPIHISPELKPRFKDTNVSMEEKADIFKKEVDLIEQAVKTAKNACSGEKFRDRIAFMIGTTGVRFIKAEDPKNIECVIYNKKDKKTETVSVKNEPKSEALDKIWDSIKRVHNLEEKS